MDMIRANFGSAAPVAGFSPFASTVALDRLAMPTAPLAPPPLQLFEMMLSMLTMLTSLMQPHASSAAAAPSPSVDSSTAPVSGRQTGAATQAADAMPGGSSFGEQLARKAEANARAVNTPGMCLRETGKILRENGINVGRHPAAYQALGDLQNNPKLREIHVSSQQLNSLPPGAIVIWNKGPGLPYGHISIALGHGREASSTVRNQHHLNSSFHVFIPK